MDVDEPQTVTEDEKKKQEEEAMESTTGNTATSELIKAAKLDDEDEEFEEFPIHGTTAGENGTAGKGTPLAPHNVWEDNWDDETVETPFHKQLEEELKKRGLKLD